MSVTVESQIKIDLENINNAAAKMLDYYELQVDLSKYIPTSDELECICFLFFKYIVGRMITDFDVIMCFRNGSQLGTVLESAARTIWYSLNTPDDVSEENILDTIKIITILYFCFDPVERSFGYLGYIR